MVPLPFQVTVLAQKSYATYILLMKTLVTLPITNQPTSLFPPQFSPSCLWFLHVDGLHTHSPLNPLRVLPWPLADGPSLTRAFASVLPHSCAFTLFHITGFLQSLNLLLCCALLTRLSCSKPRSLDLEIPRQPPRRTQPSIITFRHHEDFHGPYSFFAAIHGSCPTQQVHPSAMEHRLYCAFLTAAAGHHDHHHGAPRQILVPKGDFRATVTNSAIDQPTELPQVVVYVDQYGQPVNTDTELVLVIPASTSSSAPSTVPATDAPPSHRPLSSSDATAPGSIAAPSAIPASPKFSASPSAAPPSPGKQLYGITYSPYRGSGGCKTAAEVAADWDVFAADHGVIRIYSVDCNQVATAHTAAKKHGNTLMLGIYDISTVYESIDTMAAGIENDWDIVDTVAVGNEMIDRSAATVPQILAAIREARAALRSRGYQGPVVTIDTFKAVEDHPELCDESDYCAINCHPFFDPYTGPDQAGTFLIHTMDAIRSKLADHGKRIVVTETGWPWKGTPNGLAVPSPEAQAVALASITSTFRARPQNVMLFNAFNDLWKVPAADTFYAEQYWGMQGRYSAADGKH